MGNGCDQPPPACSGFEVDFACSSPLPLPSPGPYQGGAESLVGFPRQCPAAWGSLEEGRR